MTVVSQSKNTIRCDSSHLTSFAVLVDVHGSQQVALTTITTIQ